MIQNLFPPSTRVNRIVPKLEEAIEQTSRQEALLKEITALEKKIAAEPQPQKKFLLYKQLAELKKETTTIGL